MKRSITFSVAAALVLSACGLQVPRTNGGNNFAGGPVAGGADLPPGSDGGYTGPGYIEPGTGGPGTGGVDSGVGPGTPNDTPSDPGVVLPKGIKPYGFSSEAEGVRNDQITLCTHVPITGAAPLSRNPERFGQFYFNWVNANGGIHGRKVRMLAYDDNYNPTGARAAFEKCRRDGAFIYLGAAGTDQIVSVAKLAEQYKVPYFHGPTSDKDMANSLFNVHSAPTYEEQHRALARYLVGRFGKDKKYGMVRVNSVFFDAGHDAYVDELKKLGVTLAVDRTVQKDESSFSDVLTDLRVKNVEIVNNFSTPLIWTKMIPQAGGTYRPTWTSVSPTAGYLLVSNVLKANNAKAVVFHHFNPACNCTDMNKDVDSKLPYYSHIKQFLDIFKKYSPETSNVDDFDYGAYVTAQSLHRILEKLGPNPTRSGLFSMLNGYQEDPKATSPGCAAKASAGRRLGHSVNIFELVGGKWKQMASCLNVASF